MTVFEAKDLERVWIGDFEGLVFEHLHLLERAVQHLAVQIESVEFILVSYFQGGAASQRSQGNLSLFVSGELYIVRVLVTVEHKVQTEGLFRNPFPIGSNHLQDEISLGVLVEENVGEPFGVLASYEEDRPGV